MNRPRLPTQVTKDSCETNSAEIFKTIQKAEAKQHAESPEVIH